MRRSDAAQRYDERNHRRDVIVQVTIDMIEQEGVEQFLDELEEELQRGRIGHSRFAAIHPVADCRSAARDRRTDHRLSQPR